MRFIKLTDPNGASLDLNADMVYAITDAIDGAGRPAIGIQVVMSVAGAPCIVKGSRESVLAAISGKPAAAVDHTPLMFKDNGCLPPKK